MVGQLDWGWFWSMRPSLEYNHGCRMSCAFPIEGFFIDIWVVLFPSRVSSLTSVLSATSWRNGPGATGLNMGKYRFWKERIPPLKSGNYARQNLLHLNKHKNWIKLCDLNKIMPYFERIARRRVVFYGRRFSLQQCYLYSKWFEPGGTCNSVVWSYGWV